MFGNYRLLVEGQWYSHVRVIGCQWRYNQLHNLTYNANLHPTEEQIGHHLADKYALQWGNFISGASDPVCLCHRRSNIDEQRIIKQFKTSDMKRQRWQTCQITLNYTATWLKHTSVKNWICNFPSINLHIDGLMQDKTAVTPLLTHWSYCSLELSHSYVCYSNSWQTHGDAYNAM